MLHPSITPIDSLCGRLPYISDPNAHVPDSLALANKNTESPAGKLIHNANNGFIRSTWLGRWSRRERGWEGKGNTHRQQTREIVRLQIKRNNPIYTYDLCCIVSYSYLQADVLFMFFFWHNTDINKFHSSCHCCLCRQLLSICSVNIWDAFDNKVFCKSLKHVKGISTNYVTPRGEGGGSLMCDITFCETRNI